MRQFRPQFCQICDKRFIPTNAAAAKFCSWQCKLETKIDKRAGPEACWPFTGTRLPRGYGMLQADDCRHEYAHRLAWEKAHRRKVPKRKIVMHSCDNPSCCNPAHLFLGTHSDNTRDMYRKGRYVLSDAGRKRKSRIMKRKRKRWLVVQDEFGRFTRRPRIDR